MLRPAVVVLLLAVGACARTPLPRPTEIHVQAAQARSPGITLAELERGRTLYLTKCSSCHQPVQPSSLPAASWPAQVAAMSERAHLTREEHRLIESYVVATSGR